MTEQGNELRTGTGQGGDAPRIRLRDRDSELRSVEAAVDRLCREFAAGGTEIGDLLAFSGRPGIGKTSLLHEVRRIAKLREGATVLFARGGERQLKEPYHVLRQLLQPVLSDLRPDEFRQVMGTWEEVVGPAIGLKQPKPGARRLDPQGVRDGLDYVLTQLAPRRAPMVMIVDDLHWADAESLAWLTKFAVRSGELPVLLVFAYREDESDWPEGQEFRRSVLGLKGRKHELNRLNLTSVTDMIRAELGDRAEDAFCYEFWNVVNGNPFEVVALLDQVRDQELEPVEENSRQLRELAVDATGMTLKSWLDRLGATTLRFAWACAMLGTDIRIDLATRISTQSAEGARESIKQLRKQRVLTQAPNGNLEFVHPLIGSSIYNTMPDATRLGMHGIAAVEIENAGLGLLAASRHLVETHAGEGDDRIVKKLRRAAVEHQLIGAPEAAQRCLHRALDEPPADDIRTEVLYELGCSALLTDPVATVNQLRLALDPDEGPLRPELRVDATFRLSEVLAHSGELGQAALVCQEEARRTADPAGRQRLQAASFMWHAFRKSEEDGPGRSARLEEMSAGLAGREAADRAVLAMRAWDLTLRGKPSADALALADEVLDGGRLPKGLGWTDTMWGFELPSMLGLTYIYNDRIAQAERLFADAIIQFEVAGWSGAHRGFAYFLMGLARFRRGLLAEAEDFLRRAYRISERIGPRLPLAWDAVGVLVDTLLARGRVDEAWSWPTSSASTRRTTPPPWCCRTPPRCTASCSSPRSATPARPPRSPRPAPSWRSAAGTTPSGRPGPATSPSRSPPTSPSAPASTPRRPSRTPAPSAPPRRSAARCGCRRGSRTASRPSSCWSRPWSTWGSPRPGTSTPSPWSTSAPRCAGSDGWRTPRSTCTRASNWPSTARRSGWSSAPGRSWPTTACGPTGWGCATSATPWTRSAGPSGRSPGGRRGACRRSGSPRSWGCS
ncbi:AAA family ATPase [Streptomyces rubellomurinus]|uniref:AAA family ATPase n=1 Tax=Streptomyces rubellomurinus (strain ATCC 31215) TaxID=359131 RepID=UPI00069832BE|nr:AAA family ATPase [Streptomyces rubellomurinus]